MPQPSPQPSGFLNIDKPLGQTSHQVVGFLRRKLGLAKVGHAGTLDPLATGVLVICVGPATRLSDYMMATTKCYEADVLLGVETDTYDGEGRIVATCDAVHVTQEMVSAALKQFVGEIDQVPPMYSAIKQGGRKLYELARAGETVERAARRVQISELTLRAWSPPQLKLAIVCGAGTYIRSLAHDLGQALGVGAHLTALRRTQSGIFRVAEALTPEALLQMADWHTGLVAPHSAFADRPQVVVDAVMLEELRHGRAVALPRPEMHGLYFGFQAKGELVALLQVEDGLLKPHKVFVQAER